MPRRAWQLLRRAFDRVGEESLPDAAAALTYYSVLSLFPGMVVLVGLLGVFGTNPETSDAMLGIVDDIGPSSAAEAIEGPVRRVVQKDEEAGIALLVGSLLALYTASGYVGAFGRAGNRIFQIEEGRSFWRRRPTDAAITLVLVLLLAAVLIGLVITGPIADAVAEQAGIEEGTLSLYELVKWPVLLAAVVTVVGVLYSQTPNVRRKRFRFFSPGGLGAVVVWIAGSAGFTFYVGTFANYDKTYGTLAGVVVLLVWIFLSNLALLLGLLVDAELERDRELAAGLPAQDTLLLPPKEPKT